MATPAIQQDPLIDALAKAKRVFVFTGAGASKESGLPTFRDLDGEWRRYDPMTGCHILPPLLRPAISFALWKSSGFDPDKLLQVLEREPDVIGAIRQRQWPGIPSVILSDTTIPPSHVH